VLNTCNGIEIRGDEICDAIEQELCDGVCRLLIDKKPDYTATAYYSHKIGDETYTYDAQALEVAINYNREALADYLIDNYPGMKAHCDHKSLIEKAYKEGFSLNFIEKLIQRDPDINRLYYCTRNDPSYDGQMTTTETTLIRILTLLKGKDAVLDEICEIVRLLLENGADANIPLTKLNISESYTDEEGALLYAMEAPGDVRLLDLLIDKGGVDPNRPISRHNESQIHAMLGHRGLQDEDVLFNLKYFDQKCGLNLAQVDKNNTDLLLEAASNCRPQSLQFLLEKGARIDVIGGFDNSPPLHKAISNWGFLDRRNRARTVEVLIGAGADVAQLDSEQFTPLMSACHYGCYESAAVLLENGVDPNHENELGQNAANVIIPGEYSYDDPDEFQENKSRIFALLKEHGCRVDNVPQQGSIVLCDAIGYGYKTIFNTLLQLGLDINQKDARGLAPVMVAVQFGDIYFCNRLLKDETLDVTCRDQAGETLIHKAVRREDPETAAALIAYFIEKGVKTGLLSHGMDILGFAAYFCRHELLTPLLACAPDINNTADNGFTPLFWALCSNENINEDLRGKTMEKLTTLGADPGVTDADGKSLLHWAVMTGRNTLIPFIIGLGADVNATDATGYSPLCQLVHIAFNQADFDMDYFTQTAKILVENGAQVDRAMALSKQSDGESQITQVLEKLKK
jgi:ankyrin repeat protein